MPPIQHRIDCHDDNLWIENLYAVNRNIIQALADKCVVLSAPDILFSKWVTSINNCQVVVTMYDDIFDDRWFDELKVTSKKYNIKFTIITNIHYAGYNDIPEYKIQFYKELYGVFYNPAIKQTKINHNKLYTCLMQRTDFSRLSLFSNLSKNNLIDDGNVSLLGFQINNTKKSATEVVNDINSEYHLFDKIVSNYTFPFRNFVDSKNCFEIEEQSKYIIVSETYNTCGEVTPNWISFTEKTFRSLQIPNISILLNKNGAMDVLCEMGFKIHPINKILDYMMSFNSQTNFVIGILKNDIFDEVGHAESLHNQNLLMKWYNTLQSDDFYTTISSNLHT